MRSFIFLMMFLPLFSWARVEVTFALKKGAQVDPVVLQKLLVDPDIVEIQPLFLENEEQVLKKMGADYLVSSRKLVFRSRKALRAFKRMIRDQKIPVLIDNNEIAMKPTSVGNLSGLQWGLRNSGIAQNIDLDPMITYRVPGRVGEDIGIAGVAPVAGQKILVAVLDTGIQKDHPNLKSIIHRNESECKALDKFLACQQTKIKSECDDKKVEDSKRGDCEDKQRQECEKFWFDLKNPEVDQDGNGYPLDCSGWSLLSGPNPAKIIGRPDFGDDGGHGTHVAGIIGAVLDDASGVRGTSSHVEILPVQVVRGNPAQPIKPLSVSMDPVEDKLPRPNQQTFLGDMVARGVIYAINSGARVINFSMGWPEAQDSSFMRQMIQEAQSRGIVIVAAAGNDSTREILRPCAYPGVICVGAHGPDGAIASFSNYGSGVDVTAPGTNILSSYPEDQRPIRMRWAQGFEYLSGTSQATPFVSGLVAEMLSRGYSPSEAYSRLVLGARPVQAPLALQEGAPHVPPPLTSEPMKSPLDQAKFILSGNVDLARALAVRPQPLILPTSKERQEIQWNRKDAQLQWTFALRNHWSELPASDVKLELEVTKPHPQAIRPHVASVDVEDLGPVWASGQVRKVKVVLQIDDAQPFDSRIPSELDLSLNIVTPQSSRQVHLQAEVVVPLDGKTQRDLDVQVIPLSGFPKMRTSMTPVDENLDGKFKMDYFVVGYEPNRWTFWLMNQKDLTSPYEVKGGAKFKINVRDADKILESALRYENTAGKSEYLYLVLEPQDDKSDDPSQPMHFITLNENAEVLENYTYDSKLSQIPNADGLKWMQINGKRRAVWLAPGRDPERKANLWDLWENPDDSEKQEIRLYYLNEKYELKALQKYQDYQIVDLLTPTRAQAKKGVVPLLLAKNRGTEALPSYIYDFAVAELAEGQVQSFQALDLFAAGKTYRNLLDTRVDKVFSLDYEDEVSKGTFWFSEGKTKEQRLSILTHENFQFFDYELQAFRPKVDAALWVRTAFAGQALSGAFVLTNSEIQYHDLTTGAVVTKSMERYSFFPQNIFINIQEPLVVGDRKLGTKLPALFTAEGVGITKGVKVTVPYYSSPGQLVELVSPARLRFKGEAGCKPLDTPVWGGSQAAAFLDYICRDPKAGDKVLRVKMEY